MKLPEPADSYDDAKGLSAEELAEYRACQSKLTWSTEAAALAARAYAGWQYGDQGGRSKPYRCRYCRLWHLARHSQGI